MYPYINVLGRTIPSFGLMMVLGILIASSVAAYRAKKIKLSTDDIIMIVTVGMGMALLGAKLLYVFVTYSFDNIVTLIKMGNVNFLIESGLVFYGGLIAGAIGIYICYKIFKIDVMGYEQIIIPVIPLGHAIGRIGCFLAGCCRGIPYDGIGHVTYPDAVVDGIHTHLSYFPSQLLESALNFCIFIILMYFVTKKPKPLNTSFMYIFLYSIVRFVLEFFRGDEIRGSFNGFSTSQWISIFMFLAAITFFIGQYLYYKSKNKSV